MPLFDQTIPISADEVASVVSTHWNITLGKNIKTSQNHTFEATHTGTDKKCVVRVTPDPQQKHQSRIEKEIFFVNYVVKSNKVDHVCAPIAALNGEYIVRSGDLIIVVYDWAKGEPIDFMSYRWMTDKELVFAWGRWLAQLHQVSQKFSEDHPDIATSIQRWDQIHEGILAGSTIHPDDQAVVTDNKHYGVLHGDVNSSNFFYIEEQKTLSVFDWDQTQQGWYLWDVAQSMLAVSMLHEGGSLVDGSPIPQANPAQFEEWIVNGYESVFGEGYVDRARLARMLWLRKSFYERFCREAKAQGNLPPGMDHFINYVVGWFDKHPLQPLV